MKAEVIAVKETAPQFVLHISLLYYICVIVYIPRHGALLSVPAVLVGGTQAPQEQEPCAQQRASETHNSSAGERRDIQGL